LDYPDSPAKVCLVYKKPQKAVNMLIVLWSHNDIVLYFKKLTSEQKVPYQTLINALLRKELQEI